MARVQEPSYQVVRRIGDVEVRQYAPTVQAVTDVIGSFDRVQNEGFRRLAGYIFGGNRRQQSIAMTAPVTTAPVKIAMTAPVTTTSLGTTHRVSFTMPAGMTLASLPVPNDERVHLVAFAARTVAVLRFSGLAGEERFAAQKNALLTTLARAGVAVKGPPSLARYDPPWTLPFLRRNELQVELSDDGAAAYA